MKHVMIDIETLGSDVSSAPMIAIAAVRFDIRGGVDVENAFYRAIDLNDALNYGRVEAGTLKWWMMEDKRNVFMDIIYDKTAVLTKTALEQFYEWYTLEKGTVPWSRGIDFDFGILERLYKANDLKSPFTQFWKKRDVRTLLDMCVHAGVDKFDVLRDGDAHHALSDVIHQANEVIEYTHKLRVMTGIDLEPA